MNGGDGMDAYLTIIEDLKEQLANIDEDIPYSQLLSSTLDGLSDSCQGFDYLEAGCHGQSQLLLI